MHWVKESLEVYKDQLIKIPLTHSAKVVWGLWVLGLHEEAHQPRAQDDLSGPLPFGGNNSSHKINHWPIGSLIKVFGVIFFAELTSHHHGCTY